MKTILLGYAGSQGVLPASKYLVSKYLPAESFDVLYINHRSDIKRWTKDLATFLSYLYDEYIIFALDDYLLAGPIDMEIYNAALKELGGDVVCIKLCHSTEDEHKEYFATTQYCVWNREYLISLLNTPFVETPWEFEIECSRHYFKKTCLLRPCLQYYTNSAISSRWKGARLDGLKEEDLKFIRENNLIT